MGRPALSLLVAACLLAAVTAQSTTTSSDVGSNQTLLAQQTAATPFAGAVLTATNLCTPACQTSFHAMRQSAFNGACDACTSNTGNSSIASWGPFSTNCTTCAAQWNNYTASCAGGANKPCFNFNVVANGATQGSLANQLTTSTGAALGDVYDFFSTYTTLISTCSDMVDYVVNYAFTVANDPLNTPAVPDCPVVGGANQTCSTACNADWTILQALCTPGSTIQYDNNGMPNGQAAPLNTFLPVATVMSYILNGTAFGPGNNDTATGVDAALALSDPSCVASSWITSFASTGAPATVSMAAATPPVPAAIAAAVAATLGAGNAVANTPPPPAGTPVATAPPANTVAVAPAPAAMTCLQAAAAFNTSSNTGNCAQCTSDTGNGAGCLANCPLCATDFNNLAAACLPNGDNTLVLSFAQVNTWAQNLLFNPANFTFGDCYMYMASNFMESSAAVCSDYMNYMVYYSQTAFMVNPNNATNNGPNCPINAADTEYPASVCSPGCQADLSNLAGCTSTSTVTIGPASAPVFTAPFPVAWQAFVNGSLSTLSGAKNTMTRVTGAPYVLGACNSTLTAYAPGVLVTGAVNTAVLPAALPNCTTARATMLSSTMNGFCDACSSTTGNAANCFTSVSGDPDCTACGAQYDIYIAACNETYNDIGNTFAANLLMTTAAGTAGDCFDFFNQLAQSSIGTTGFDTDACSDSWDSIVQYSETVLNDPLTTAPPGPNCPTVAGATCSLACNNDLAQLSAFCTASSVVQWAGYGMVNSSGAVVAAPAGTNVSIATAWLYFVNGTATAPIGDVMAGSTSLPFALGNCTLPSWAPTTGPGSAAGLAPVVVQGSFTLNLGSVTLAQLYSANTGNAIEGKIASSLGVAPAAVTIMWTQLLSGRRLMGTSIPYTVTVTQAQQATVAASVSTFNPTALTATIAALPNLPAGASITAAPAPAASAASVFTPAVALTLAAVAAAATLI